LNQTFSKPLNVSLSLSKDLSIGGAAGLTASGNLDVKLDFGIDLQNPAKVYMFDGTGLAGNVTASGTGLNFKAALGPAGILVKDGTVTLTAGATAGIADVFTNHYVLLTS